MKAEKGHHGYLTKRKRTLLVRSLVLFAVIGGVVAAGILITGSVKNWFSIFACLIAIPFAMQLATFFSIVKYKGRSDEEYESVKTCIGNGVLGSEYLIANRDGKPFLIDYAYIHETGIYLCITEGSIDARQVSDYLRNYLRLSDCDGEIRIAKSLSSYLSMLKSLSPSDRDTVDESLLRQEGVFKAISM